MRTPYAVGLLLTLVLAGVYWYTSVGVTCKTPVTYRIGAIDGRFNIDQDEVRQVVDEAIAIWENATGRALFKYDPAGDVAINFIYDDRQQSADTAEQLKEQLDQQKNVNESITETYDTVVAEYHTKEAVYEERKQSYEQALQEYNDEVASYNESGGAPPDVYKKLNQRQRELDAERQTVNQLARELNDLGAKINELSEKGNEIVTKYNENVASFNEQYGHSEEFTQGDYQGDSINIYKFESDTELELVLAHELGHALSLDHVDNDTSIMYYLMGDQPMDDIGLSKEDLAEFQAVCGLVTPEERLLQMWQQFTSWLTNPSAI